MSWSVRGHEHRERSNDWYWGLGFIAVAVAGAAIFFGNFLFAVIILISASSIGFLVARGPREHSLKLDQRGIIIDGTRYPYASVHSFWVEHDTGTPRVFISMNGLVTPHLSFPLQDETEGTKVREFLKHYVAEEEQGPHVGERLAEIFGL